MNYSENLHSNFSCENGIPSVGEFFKEIQGYKIGLIVLPACNVIFIFWIFFNNLRYFIKNIDSTIRTNLISLNAIYPIVVSCSLVAICIPRAYFFMDSIGHISFMIICYQLLRLLLIYIDGESNFISLGRETFTFRTPPLCCCMPFLSHHQPSKSKFNLIRFLILQMAMMHIIIFIILNIINIEDTRLFDRVILYFIPLIAVTVLGGIWGFNLAIRMISPNYISLNLPQKYFSYQLVLFFCKIQPIFLNLIMKRLIKTCEGPFTIIVKRHSK
jgi:organic solute transporter subunit alpha